jgi:phospholipid/cholesterol/gamma-HCH transport system substrate-binding protein
MSASPAPVSDAVSDSSVDATTETRRFSKLSKSGPAQMLRRIPPRTRLVTVIVLVAALLVAGIVALVTSGPSQMTITAEFATAPGLYPGNQVRILGMPVGQITSITPHTHYVDVAMQVPSTTKIPANAQAFIMAPEVVNDRYVQLNPAYTGGARMGDNTVIPPSRTAVPISVDGIIDSLNSLAKALGPNGANKGGALNQFIESAAHSFGSNGEALHSTLDSLGKALGALSSQGPQLTALFDNLGNLSHVASQYTGTYQSFANDLAAVSTDLASDDSDIGNALGNLQVALGQLAEFIRTNGSALGTSVKNLEAFAGAVASKQQQLGQAFNDLPTALNNITQAYDPTAPGGPALRSRLDLMSGSASFSKEVCGNDLLRLLLLSVDQSQDNNKTIDLACGVSGLLANLPTPPGASSGPNLSVSALVGGQS